MGSCVVRAIPRLTALTFPVKCPDYKWVCFQALAFPSFFSLLSLGSFMIKVGSV